MTTTPRAWFASTLANTFDANVTNQNSADQYDASIVALPNGGYAEFWTDFSLAFKSGGGSAVTGQLFSATGQKIGGEVKISTYVDGDQGSSAATLLTNKNVAIAYMDTYNGISHVHVATTSPNLNPPQDTLIDFSSVSSFAPSITAFGGGAYLVTYTLQQNNDDIVGKIVSASGSVGPLLTIGGSANADELSQAATLTNGNAVVVYEHANGSDYDIYYNLISPNGTSASGGSQAVSGGSNLGQYEFAPAVTALKSGGFVVVWETFTGANYDIYGTIYNNAGAVVASHILLNSSNTAGDQLNPSVVALEDGFVVSWDDYNTSTVASQRFDNLGHSIGSQYTVANGTSGYAPQEALLNDGRVAYAFDQYNGTDYNVYHSIFTPNLTTPTDFNGDTSSDILFQRADGSIAIWQMNGTDYYSSGVVGSSPGATWKAVTTADFGGDFKTDILWQNSDGTPMIWQMNGSQIQSSATLTNPGSSWHIATAGDFDGDGKADILWQKADGSTVMWFMDGTTIAHQTGVLFNPGSSWKAVATGDFNADGHSDIVWQNSNGTPVIWEMNGGSTLVNSGNLTNPGAAWKVVATGDFNADGHSDILWQNTSNNSLDIWEMNGTSIIKSSLLSSNPGSGWHAVETGDFNHDGKSDIVLHNDNGQVAVWEMNGTDIQHIDINGYNPGSAWHIV
jgi:hypothetical protein